jgi:hypothetical protein
MACCNPTKLRRFPLRSLALRKLRSRFSAIPLAALNRGRQQADRRCTRTSVTWHEPSVLGSCANKLFCEALFGLPLEFGDLDRRETRIFKLLVQFRQRIALERLPLCQFAL